MAFHIEIHGSSYRGSYFPDDINALDMCGIYNKMLFVSCGSLMSSQVFRSLSTLPQVKAFQLLGLFFPGIQGPGPEEACVMVSMR